MTIMIPMTDSCGCMYVTRHDLSCDLGEGKERGREREGGSI